MAAASQKTENLRQFDPYTDQNGQNPGDVPNELARPAELQDRMKRSADGESETARLASGRPNDDATDAVEAEIPAGTVAHLSDPGQGGDGSAAKDGVDSATASLGSPD